jgi:hypothetical protein
VRETPKLPLFDVQPLIPPPNGLGTPNVLLISEEYVFVKTVSHTSKPPLLICPNEKPVVIKSKIVKVFFIIIFF